jgi:uncharacterized membrane protein YjgN (DUF898 family)
MLNAFAVAGKASFATQASRLWTEWVAPLFEAQGMADGRTRASTRPVTWVEPDESLWILSLRNFGLTLATFGVWYFWGSVEARRRIVGSVRINGRPLDHTGNGMEGFVSFLIGAVVAASLVSLFVTLFIQTGAAAGVAGGVDGLRAFRWQRLAITLPLLFLIGSAVYRKRRHILRRTSLDGRRFDLVGHPWHYAAWHFVTAFLIPLSAGWAAPWRASRLEAMKIKAMRYEGVRFDASSTLRPLYKAFALLWVGGGFLYVVTLVVLARFIGPEILGSVYGGTLVPLQSAGVARQGLVILAVGLVPLFAIVLIYRKAWLEHRVSSLVVDGARFRLDMPTSTYMRLAASNAALTIGSLGAFAPVAEARLIRAVVGHLRVDGELTFAPRPA